MQALTRHVLRLWGVPTLWFLLATIAVLLLGRVMHALEYIAEKGLSWSWLGLLALAVLPYFLVLAAPIAIYAGLVVALSSMQEHNEWTAALALGRSPWEVLRPVFVVAALVGAFLVWASLVWAPWGAQSAQLVLQKLRTSGALTIAPQRFNEELGPFVLYAERTLPDGRMQGVLVEDRRLRRGMVVIWAREARMAFSGADLVLAFTDGVRFEREGEARRVVEFARYEVRMSGVLGQSFRLPEPSTAGIARLWHAAKRGSRWAQAELVRRIALPLALPILLCLAPVVALRRARTLPGVVYGRALLLVLVVENALLATLRAADKGGLWLWLPLVVGLLGTVASAIVLARRLARLPA